DRDKREVRVTFWDSTATAFKGKFSDVLCSKNACIKAYKDITIWAEIHEINLKCAQAQQLGDWFRNDPLYHFYHKLQKPYKYANQLNLEIFNNSIDDEFIQLNALVLRVKPSSDHFYQSCGYRHCLKKVTFDHEKNCYVCPKCGNLTTEPK